MKNYSKKYGFIIAVAVVFAVSIFLRFYHLSTITGKIFDEIYFPVFAHDYLTKTSFFDAHPPLGKLIIAVGEAMFGNQSFGWRVMDASFGCLLLAAIYGFAYDLTHNKKVALMALLLTAIEPLALVESRVGLINIYLAFFTVISLWSYWRWLQREGHPWYELAIAAVAFGAASAVKWIGIGALGTAAFFTLILLLLKQYPKPYPKWWQAFFLLLIPAVYFATFIPDILNGQDIWWWHNAAWTYQITLKATHPYGSAWWTWALDIRPIWLYFQSVSNNNIVGIIELGNIFTWIGGIFALIYLAIDKLNWDLSKKSNQALAYLTVGYLALYLPWMLISRVKFIYHYFDPVLLLLIILAIVLERLIKSPYHWLAYIFLIVAAAFFIYFLPLLIGLPVSMQFYQQHMWLKSWI